MDCKAPVMQMYGQGKEKARATSFSPFKISLIRERERRSITVPDKNIAKKASHFEQGLCSCRPNGPEMGWSVSLSFLCSLVFLAGERSGKKKGREHCSILNVALQKKNES